MRRCGLPKPTSLPMNLLIDLSRIGGFNGEKNGNENLIRDYSRELV
jgi:hypothetical protein